MVIMNDIDQITSVIPEDYSCMIPCTCSLWPHFGVIWYIVDSLLSFQSRSRESWCQSGGAGRVCSGPALLLFSSQEENIRSTSAAVISGPPLISEQEEIRRSSSREWWGGRRRREEEGGGGSRQTEVLETLSRDRIFSPGWRGSQVSLSVYIGSPTTGDVWRS